MDFDRYQQESYEFAVYKPGDKGIYPSLGLCGEAGEVCAVVKRYMRGDAGAELDRETMIGELSDVAWYLFAEATDFGLVVSELAPGTIDEYTPIFPYQTVHELAHGCICLVSLCSTVAGDPAALRALCDEVILRIAYIAYWFGATLEDVLTANLTKLAGRAARGTIKGIGHAR